VSIARSRVDVCTVTAHLLHREAGIREYLLAGTDGSRRRGRGRFGTDRRPRGRAQRTCISLSPYKGRPADPLLKWPGLRFFTPRPAVEAAHPGASPSERPVTIRSRGGEAQDSRSARLVGWPVMTEPGGHAYEQHLLEIPRALGHDLGDWDDRSEGSVRAHRATCASCGRIAYVRVEGGLSGAAGSACRELCPASRSKRRVIRSRASVVLGRLGV
jgi:hypothetical protein